MASSLKFTRQVRLNGVLTNADSAEMAAQAPATYAVRRLDTGAEVVTAPAVAVNEATGIYSYTLAAPVHEPVPGVTYEAVFHFVINGADYWIPTEKVGGPAVAWLDYTKFLRRFGLRNVALASDKDNENATPTVEQDVVDDAFIWAEAEINRHLRGGIYAVPLDWSSNGGVVDPAVEEWGFVLAYHHIYYGRFEDTNMVSDASAQQENQLSKMVSRLVSQTYADIAMCRAGLLQLPATTATDYEGTSVPLGSMVVTVEDVLEERYLGSRRVSFPALP